MTITPKHASRARAARTRGLRTAIAGLLTLAIVPLTAASASAASAVAPTASRSASGVAETVAETAVPALAWHPCHDGFQCATVRVPLDYRHGHGATIDIAVIRHRATDPAHRIGTLFVNGGGPVEQIDSVVAQFGAIPAQLRQRFDIVTFDPRGFGYSTAIRCFPSVAAQNAFLAALPPFPNDARQDAAWERTYARFDALCAQRGGPLLGHDTTADVARDMDLIRQAVGAPTLNYIGLSSATGLGAVYANLFPVTTGHMVLDGNVDPVAWTSGGPRPSTLREGADVASAATLRSFLELCGAASTSACAFSAGRPAATVAKFAALARRVSAHPLTIGTPPQTVTYADLLTSVPIRTVSQWQDGALFLQQLWIAATAGGATSGTTGTGGSRASVAGTATAAYTGLDQTYANLCADAADPRDPAAYARSAAAASARSGGFASLWAWTEEACADWPASAGQDRYTGPWNRPTASPILVIGNTGDPVTPYQGAIAMSRDLARARLLTVDGNGHTEFSNPSTCATNYEIAYLETGALPSAGTACPQDGVPFPPPTS
jgi:pimeloyl-ACP methyl ester carboxylesterase